MRGLRGASLPSVSAKPGVGAGVPAVGAVPGTRHPQLGRRDGTEAREDALPTPLSRSTGRPSAGPAHRRAPSQGRSRPSGGSRRPLPVPACAGHSALRTRIPDPALSAGEGGQWSADQAHPTLLFPHVKMGGTRRGALGTPPSEGRGRAHTGWSTQGAFGSCWWPEATGPGPALSCQSDPRFPESWARF